MKRLQRYLADNMFRRCGVSSILLCILLRYIRSRRTVRSVSEFLPLVAELLPEEVVVQKMFSYMKTGHTLWPNSPHKH
jgi:hypothetical protein